MIQQTYTNPKVTTELRDDFKSPELNDWPGVVVELQPAPDPSDVFRRLCHLPHCIFFDSAMADPELGRYSFIAADPYDWLAAAPDDASLWNHLAQRLRGAVVPTLPGL
ncbi:MAG TPA: hypothetical protein VGI75_14980, partial [Pirellulales bacterium]